jgi:phosphoglucosamine mutase
MRLFGTSGIRRAVDFNLVQLALQVGAATGTMYKNVVVGRDTRTSGSALRHAITAGLLASGARCSDAGVLPTPTLAYITSEFEAGMMITASHNPPQYNGIKMLNPDGSAFSSQQQNQIEDLVSGKVRLNTAWEKMISGELYNQAVEKHISRIMQDFPGGIRARVTVDSGCGAAYDITPRLLAQLGCEVTALNCYANGIFPHDIEPIEANLSDLMRAVKETGADVGIAHDGDADRMMAVDDLGRFISGDKMLAILGRASESRKIVTTIDASMSIEEMNFEVTRTRVGDPYVSEELKKGGGFGGEPSGAWVFPQVSLCPDGIYAAARIAAIASRQKLSVLVDSIPAYPVVRGSLAGIISSEDYLRERLISEFQPAAFDTIDGIKMNFKDGWILIRASGTEPKIRLSVEARSETLARKYYQASEAIIKENIQGSSR